MDANIGAPLVGTRYQVECFDKHGRLKWRDTAKNLVVNEGLDDLLEQYFLGSAYTASHFVGLTDGAPTIAAGDTLASQAGWNEVTAYTGDRKAFQPGAVSGQSTNNSANRAEFTINANNTTIGGLFLTTAETGTSGVLYGAAAFDGGDKQLDDEDVLRVTATATAAAA